MLHKSITGITDMTDSKFLIAKDKYFPSNIKTMRLILKYMKVLFSCSSIEKLFFEICFAFSEL